MERIIEEWKVKKVHRGAYLLKKGVKISKIDKLKNWKIKLSFLLNYDRIFYIFTEWNNEDFSFFFEA
jgi:hypothetical protein